MALAAPERRPCWFCKKEYRWDELHGIAAWSGPQGMLECCDTCYERGREAMEDEGVDLDPGDESDDESDDEDE